MKCFRLRQTLSFDNKRSFSYSSHFLSTFLSHSILGPRGPRYGYGPEGVEQSSLFGVDWFRVLENEVFQVEIIEEMFRIFYHSFTSIANKHISCRFWESS
jgi:hypothetical protein